MACPLILSSAFAILPHTGLGSVLVGVGQPVTASLSLPTPHNTAIPEFSRHMMGLKLNSLNERREADSGRSKPPPSPPLKKSRSQV